jgi:protein SERAC1
MPLALSDCSITFDDRCSMKETIAVTLGLLYAGEVPLSLEDFQRLSGIVLCWLFNKFVSDKTHLITVKNLSSILEDYGPV